MLDSAPEGGGASITLTLVAAGAPADSAVKKGGARHVLRLQPGHAEVRVLVADDMPANRELLEAILVPAGFRVRTAENGAVAVSLVESWSPHAVLMDMRMPVMDGYEANRRIKAMSCGANTYILALTASAFEEQKSQVLASGADDFMRKPFKQDELLQLLGAKLGLTYEYEGEPASAAVTPADRELVPADLVALEDSVRTDLLRAVSAADYDRLVELCEALVAPHPKVAAGLRALADRYDYAALTRLLAGS